MHSDKIKNFLHKKREANQSGGEDKILSQHEKGKLRRSLSEHVGGVREGNLVPIGVRAINVVKADRDLRDNF